jgi:hypothetical protein
MAFFKHVAEEIEQPLEIGRLSSDAGPAMISIQCPHCGEVGSFEFMDRTILTFHRSGKKAAGGIEYIASIRVCPNVTCKGLIFTITDGAGVLCTCYTMKLVDARGASGARRGGASRTLAYRPSANSIRSVGASQRSIPCVS